MPALLPHRAPRSAWRRRLTPALVLACACLSWSAAAADQSAPVMPVMPVTKAAGAALAPLFARPVILRGTLDGAQIQMTLHLKPGEADALEGDYFVVGRNDKVLLAGEFEEDALMMEESANGKDVSGLWDGVYDGAVLRGNWSSVDGSVLRPFVLKAAPARQ
jgi:hypothetical protein